MYGAIFCILLVWCLLLWIVLISIDHILEPVPVDWLPMLITGVITFATNIMLIFIASKCGLEGGEFPELDPEESSVD